ncbi:hypothetical protein E2562_036782 [Oryza meyeriana var. granulata]|uniref:Uncharacterized protein n=1 Tax=Oryza meyeriana var. granulata TaxID=110450 RepID=A0A6G1CCM5_9ORYZ|nr:hypothetical protein E2562_036782 [Oryza meyeriana var. granulata]
MKKIKRIYETHLSVIWKKLKGNLFPPEPPERSILARTSRLAGERGGSGSVVRLEHVVVLSGSAVPADRRPYPVDPDDLVSLHGSLSRRRAERKEAGAPAYG